MKRFPDFVHLFSYLGIESNMEYLKEYHALGSFNSSYLRAKSRRLSAEVGSDEIQNLFLIISKEFFLCKK